VPGLAADTVLVLGDDDGRFAAGHQVEEAGEAGALQERDGSRDLDLLDHLVAVLGGPRAQAVGLLPHGVAALGLLLRRDAGVADAPGPNFAGGVCAHAHKCTLPRMGAGF
jgi:hypothetical protein